MADITSALSETLAALHVSGKYAHISEDLLHRIATEELSKRHNTKEAIKAAKNKLHQIGGAYQGDMRYAKWLQTLTPSPPHPVTPASSLLQPILAQHTSTRERLPLLDTFYQRIFGLIPMPITSILDVACGLNPLTLLWMPLPKDVRYLACDIYGDMMDFLNQCFAQFGYANAQAEVCDVLSAVLSPESSVLSPQSSVLSPQSLVLSSPVDVAFVLKTIPCLEQVEKTIGPKLLDVLQARYIVVSFPAQSLGGRNKNMAANYAAHFADIIAGRPWQVQRLDFATELVFVIQTNK